MIRQLYFVSPSFVQNLLISMYGIKTFANRFIGNIPSEYSSRSSLLRAPLDEDFKDQHKRLQMLLERCKHKVPYYHDLLKDVDISKINRNNLDQYFPVLTKKNLLENMDAFVDRELVGGSIKVSTGGTSGTPLTVYATKESRLINYWFFNQFLQELGSSYRSRSTTLAGREIYRSGTEKVARYDMFNRTQYLSVFNISEDTVAHYIDALNYWRPEYIDSYPSALFEIQFLAKKRGIRGLKFKPKFILTSSETLAAPIKKEVENFFGAKIFDHYGCAEMAISSYSDGYQYYCPPLYGVVELKEKSEGLYAVIATGLLNFCMPLIRYEIGDLVCSSDPSNPYIFERVEGREDDTIITPEGKLIGRISPVFKGIQGIENSQVIQESLSDLVVNIVIRNGQKELFDESLLVKRIKEIMSPEFKVKINYVSGIKKESNGKFKSVISKVHRI